MRLAEPLSRGPISTSRALSTAIHRNQQWVLECLGTVAVIRHLVPASSQRTRFTATRKLWVPSQGAPEPVPGRHTICSRGPMAAPKEPFASICDISSFPTAGKSNSQPTSRIGHARSAAEAHGALGAENNFAHRKPGQDLGVEPTAPGGVPPSPQPLTHPAIRPWPFWPGSSFLGGAARNRRIRGGGLCPPDKPRVLSRVAVATDDV